MAADRSRRRLGAGLPEAVAEPYARQHALDRGEAETRTLAEGLAVDQAVLMRAVFPELAWEFDPHARLPISRRMAAAGALLQARLPAEALDALRAHPSDTVRGWAAFAIAAAPDLPLATRLQRLRPLADDPHFGVREWAWLALRPHTVAAVGEAIELLLPWAREDSPYLRRFAVEATRPRGVWSTHIDALKQDPALGLPLLEPLRADPARYVQDSVANWLNDAAKSQPDWVRGLCERWRRESPQAATERICTRATRSLRERAPSPAPPPTRRKPRST